MGKTTLAKMVFNDVKLKEHFKLKMWVCVSEKFELEVLVEKMIEAATGSKPGERLETLQRRLRGLIKRRKYLLVLDDVWNEDRKKWIGLIDLLSDCRRGSWIVITTRSQVVAQITRTVPPYMLEGLSEGESWSLLKQMAFKEKSQESNDSQLKEIGMEIAEMCEGVPLALKAIGNLLFNKTTKEEWGMVKNNVHEYLTQQETGVLPNLKLSYDLLLPPLRKCFAYCSLIPKKTKLEVKELVLLWMAQGLIPLQRGDKDPEDVGHEYFMELLWRFFFQVKSEDSSGNVESFMMHDLMHDLACSIAGAEFCVASLESKNVNERTRHLSFVDKFDSSRKISSSLCEAKRLRTFIQRRGGSLDVSTCSSLMSGFKYLRVFNLSNSDIEKLPDSIGKLKHLRYLDLSGNPNIRKLPSSLSGLQNLQTLNLKCCKRHEKLPRETRKLVHLRHLRLDGCQELAYMPRGLGQLTCLRTLSMFVVGNRGGQVAELKELTGLTNLKELHITSLQKVIPEPESTFLKDISKLKSLELSWSVEESDKDDVIVENAEIVIECLQPHQNLQKLHVNGYPGSKISNWLSSITNLTELSLRFCGKCKHLPTLLYQLSSLKVLELKSLRALEKVFEIEMQTEIFFPSLMELRMVQCPNLKGWWKGDAVEASNAQLPCFPCLSNLNIEGCRNLTSMPLFPSVRVMDLIATSGKLLEQTLNLKMTTSEATPTSSSSSSSLFLPFSKLQILHLKAIEDLYSLPEEFLQNLTSLQYLGIESCVNLRSMPEGMLHLTALKQLRINGCPHLSKRCQMKIGDDWPNINHIEDLQID